jgi:uncharacterized protein YjiS (DUF1127 family)
MGARKAFSESHNDEGNAMCRQEQDFDCRKLTPEQWNALKRYTRHNAQAVRTQALRDLFGIVPLALRTLGLALAAAAGRWWTHYIRWRERRAAVRELAALDDRTLKDLGIYRSEIETVILGREVPPRLGQITVLRPCASDEPSRPRNHRAPAPSLEKNAA